MAKKQRGNTRPSYPPEFRRRMVELVRAGRAPEALGREFEPSAPSIRHWVRQADLDEGKRSDGLTTEDREELVRLRRENRVLREEKEILRKAAAWFAQETQSTATKRSGS
jgi:transposase